MSNIKLIHGDCMDIMRNYPDKYFDLAIVDTEYGIGASKPSKKPERIKQKNGSYLIAKNTNYIHKEWDNKPADANYFNELLRVSKHQIIFGVNYYKYIFPQSGRIVWDKLNGETDQFGCEIAYCSFNNRTDIVYYMWSGMIQGSYIGKDVRKALKQIGDKRLNEKRIHPTQKPIKLYQWILDNYSNKDMRILDTHLGSGSSAIAAHQFGIKEFLGVELDEDYFKASKKRFDLITSQQLMF